MGSNVWYLNENAGGSSYTDFTYTDLTAAGSRPVRRRPVNNAPSKMVPVQRTLKPVPAQAVRRKAAKKRSAGKVFLGIFGAFAIAAVTFLIKDNVVEAYSRIINEDAPAAAAAGESEVRKVKKVYEKTGTDSYDASTDMSGPAYEVAENILATLCCGDDIDTAWEIFNWVHSNIYYQPILTPMTYEEAAYRGFTRKSGDCYVSFACAKMLLDCAGIPNIQIERYPVTTDAHYWNLVQLGGEWYHCDATVFKDHPGMYFMCTDDEICDAHHSFDGSLYPERAGRYDDGWYCDDWYADEWYGDEPYADDWYGDSGGYYFEPYQ